MQNLKRLCSEHLLRFTNPDENLEYSKNKKIFRFSMSIESRGVSEDIGARSYYRGEWLTPARLGKAMNVFECSLKSGTY
jgi:hypothetical protein